MKGDAVAFISGVLLVFLLTAGIDTSSPSAAGCSKTSKKAPATPAPVVVPSPVAVVGGNAAKAGATTGRKVLAAEPPAAAPSARKLSDGAKTKPVVKPGMLERRLDNDAALDVTVWVPPETPEDYVLPYIELLVKPAAKGGRVTVRRMGRTIERKWAPQLDENVIHDPHEANILIVDAEADEEHCDTGVVSKAAYLTPAVSLLIRDRAVQAACVDRKLSDMTPFVLRQFHPRRRAMPLPNVKPMPSLAMPAGEALDLDKNNAERPATYTVIALAGGSQSSAAEKAITTALPNAAAQDFSASAGASQFARVSFAVFVVGASAAIDTPLLYAACRQGAIPVVVAADVGLAKSYLGHFPVPPQPCGKDAKGCSADQGIEIPFMIVDSADKAADAIASKAKAGASDLDAERRAVQRWAVAVEGGAVWRVHRMLLADYLKRQTLHVAGQRWAAAGRPDIAARFLRPVEPWIGSANRTLRYRAPEEIRPPAPKPRPPAPFSRR